MNSKKRVLVNIGSPEDPYWAFVDPVLVPVTAGLRPPKPPPVKRQKQKPKAFANPNHAGYGGGETPWPFDRVRAFQDGRYRAGIRNAIKSDWVASNWRYAAQRELAWITQDLIDLDLLADQPDFNEW